MPSLGKTRWVDSWAHSDPAYPFLASCACVLTKKDQSAALLSAIKEYDANKWKFIGQKVGKPAKVCAIRPISRSRRSSRCDQLTSARHANSMRRNILAGNSERFPDVSYEGSLHLSGFSALGFSYDTSSLLCSVRFLEEEALRVQSSSCLPAVARPFRSLGPCLSATE